MNDNPGGGCGGVLIWLLVIGIGLAIIGAVFGVGPMGGDKYHCYVNTVGINREVNMLKGLNEEEARSAQRRGADCYLTR